ncbi:6-phosphofructokinase [Paenibacillus ehimensis]|uniref:6-phosphofructokinase n=1 Tax=Paenibacillus ehimensis TaxID=79264 RepID=UPI000470DE44|nr:6-phosphofructokinase [Paenibacillus ehimensis]
MRKIAVLTSGGDAPGMNVAIRAVVREGIRLGCEVFGVYGGYEGLIEGKIRRLSERDVGGIIHRGGTMLQTSRSERFRTAEGRAQAVRQLQASGIEGVVVIGGNGSFEGAKKLEAEGVATVCIPGTIDNDMPGTEMTLGFDTAVNTVVEAADRIRDTSFSHDRIGLIEVMGRHSGSIALWAGVACGAEYVIVPEIEFRIEDLIRKVQASIRDGKRHSIILSAEGVGSGADIASRIKAMAGYDVRTTVLGHLQRGGSPTAADRVLGSRWGVEAVHLLTRGERGRLLGIVNNRIVAHRYDDPIRQENQSDISLATILQNLSI